MSGARERWPEWARACADPAYPDSTEGLRRRALDAETEVEALRRRLDNAAATIRGYQEATQTDYPGSLREHQKVADLIAAGRAFREQWRLPEVEALRAERDRLRAALAELVTLKDGPRDAEYERRKPLAWAAAREALSAAHPETEAPDAV